MDGQLDAALQRLETALAEFRSAYEAWLADGDEDDLELRRKIADAEARLDEARQALAKAQSER